EAPHEDRLTSMLNDSAQQALELELNIEPPPAEMETLADASRAPVTEPGSYSGGTGLFQKQSDCPFRAFAEIRLKAKAVSTPRPGLDAGTRGSLVHKALEAFWRDQKDASHLHSIDDEDLQQQIEQSAEQALREQFSRYRLAISRASRALEKQRLIKLLQQWLEVEKQRPAFRVQALEQPVEITLGGIQTNGSIDRIDRLDTGNQADQPTLLIDYKTGASAGSGQWLPEARMRDVQLPAYALSLQAAPSGIAFARLLPANVEFDGIQSASEGNGSHATTDTPGIRIIGRFTRKHALGEHESWLELLNDWRSRLEALAEQFLAGQAEVNPRDDQRCRYCHLHAFCRIHERAVFSPDETNE
ncbi:MAG: PD-(D/E)XK nuclease family protein, partial [Pseudomonadota bacterium]